MKRIITALVAASAASTFAGDFIQWTDTSVSLLAGTGFEVDPEDQTTVTLEHANGWEYGDFFWFNDFIYFNGDQNSAGDDASYYGEIAPRFSLNKMTGKDLSVAFIKDWLIATCYEYGRGVNLDEYGHNMLVGAGVDLDVPGMDFVQLNAYQRFDLKGGNGESIQLTGVWKYSRPMGKTTFIFDGFLDWVVNDDGLYSKNLHFCPQVKFDIGTLWGWNPNRLNVGVEYDYWSNKYGIKDSNVFPTTQSAISLLVKSHF
ncbi:Nucleoside-specific channel-forming protein tsx [Pontiella desulfatans]|uniref:Nucleoside-specific channel-forming protein tsx n=1 Tax=Pontiella desulfatans TaxID=2750659 RepID=A0A6C2UBE1_PONDE|nr:outer membrane protein OmpK [Pontiella desulfatans]VGO16761.1 Nucleoside-specific channel-forming protein tsx [Pontiella desulfatans]